MASDSAGIPEKRRVGRPRFVPDYRLTAELAGMGCTDPEIARGLGCDVATVERIRARDPKFREACENGRADVKMSLRRKQLRLAELGDKTMLVWLGKVLLGQRESFQVATPPGEALRVESFEQTPERIAAVLGILTEAGVFGGPRANGHDTTTDANDEPPTLQ